MCGRVVIALDSDVLVSISRSKSLMNKESYLKSYNIPPTRGVPVVYRSSRDSKDNEIEIMKFGMKNNNKIEIINARAETMRQIQLFNNMILKYNRCGIIVQGYYEWKVLDLEGKKKQPYFIKHKSKEFIILAGLFREVEDSKGEYLKEFVIITRPSEGEISNLHSRMPLFVSENDLEYYINNLSDWINKDLELDKVFNLLMKTKTDLTFYPVGDLVNKLSNYGKDNIIHKDEIKYNKNKNLKIKQFLFDINENRFEIRKNLNVNDETPIIETCETVNKIKEKIDNEILINNIKLIDVKVEQNEKIINNMNELEEKGQKTDNLEKNIVGKKENLKRRKTSILKSKKKNAKDHFNSLEKTNKKITNFFKK